MSVTVEAENAVLGAAMFAPGDCQDAFDRLRAEHFTDPFNAHCWATITALWTEGKLPDPVSVCGQVGGWGRDQLAHLADLVDRANTYALAGHVDLLLEQAARRSLEVLIKDASAALYATQEPSEALLARLERGAADIARNAFTGVSAVPAGLAALESFEAAARGDYRGLETGLECLDLVTGGIKQDDVWVFGGRSSMGKSVVGVSVARHIADRRRGVLMFSLEMPLREVQARLIADTAHHPDASQQIRYGDVLNGRVPHQLHDRARSAARRLASLPFMVIDKGSFTIEDIRRQALRQVRGWERAKIEPGAVLIDHLGLVQPTRKTDNKAADTSDTVNELKGIAKQIGCPIIALAQVNRGPENRSDHRPTMGDLNWSGSIEQIADFVCLLYREAYYLARTGKDADVDRAYAVEHEMELLIQKNRSGPICTKKAWVDVACNALRDPPRGWAA